MTKETKFIGGRVVEVKQEERNGVPVGIVAGYIATWDIDRGAFGIRDQFVRGAFVDSLREHQAKNRPVRLKDHHGRTVGGFPISSVYEDEVGLYGIGEINLEVQQGKELMSLAKQGVLSEFSVGFSVIEFTEDEGLRRITKAVLWEGSVVDEPMNPKAVITEVKSSVPFQDLPLASRDREWNSSEALSRVKEFTNSDESPSGSYKKAFLWYDENNEDSFGGYKLPIADIIEGELTAVPRAIFAAAASLSGARGGVDIPEVDRNPVINHVERYYAKMGMPSPFEENDKRYFIADDVKDWTERDIEKALRRTGMFSKAAARILSSKLSNVEFDKPDIELQNIVLELAAIKRLVK